MDHNIKVVQLTKKYIIELLNHLFFQNTMHWEGIDQFNELPILKNEDMAGGKLEQRGALIVSQHKPIAFRVLITVQDGTHLAVCYRIAPIKASLKVNISSNAINEKTVFPFATDIDMSLSDGSVGIRNISVSSFSINSEIPDSTIFGFVSLLLDSYIIKYDDAEVFEDLLDCPLSQIPYPGDSHFKPIFYRSETA